MKKITYVCDVCGKEIAEEIEKYTSLNSVAVILTAKNIVMKKTQGTGTATAAQNTFNSGVTVIREAK